MRKFNVQMNKFEADWESNLSLQRKYDGGVFNRSSVAREKYAEEQKRVAFQNSITPEIRKLDQYIATLSRSTRFKNVTGPLYDPVNGWNPGYRVMAKDLMTIIPFTPFSAIT